MTKSEIQAEDAQIDAAAADIAVQAARIDAMRDCDPQKLAGRRILNVMRHNQAAVLVNRSMRRGETSDRQVRSAAAD